MQVITPDTNSNMTIRLMMYYKDVVVHRLLHACIDPDAPMDSDLINTNAMKDLCDNLNFRNRMAQQAGRSSVELFTSMFFRNKVEIEEARVLRVLKNSISVLVPKYGLESIVYISEPFEYNEEHNSLVAGDIVLKTFDKVKVEMSVEGDAEGMRQKMNMKLIEPKV